MKRRRDRRDERAVVLIVALLVVVMTMTAAFLLVAELQIKWSELRSADRRLHLTTLADSATALAAAQIARDPFDFNDGSQKIGSGEVEWQIGALVGQRRQVNIEARWGGSRSYLEVIFQVRDPAPPSLLSWRRTRAP